MIGNPNVVTNKLRWQLPTHLGDPAAEAARVEGEGGQAGGQAGQVYKILHKYKTSVFSS